MGARTKPRAAPRFARRRAALAPLALAAFSVALWLPHASQAAWYYPETLTGAGAQATFPTIASNGSGDVVAAWYRLGRAGDRIEVRTSRNGGRTWGPLQDLGPALIARAGNRPALVRAAVGTNGTAVVTWQQRAGSSQRVVAATAKRGARFGRARVLSAPGAAALYPDVAVAGSGRAAVIWVTPAQVQRVLISPNGAVGRPRTVARESGADEPTVAADPRGDLVFAWVEQTSTIPPRTPVLAARESARGAVTAPQQLSPTGADLPQAVIAPNGRATVAWESGPGAATPVVLASSAPWGRRFGAAQRLSTPGPLAILGGGAAGSRGLGVDSSGHVTAIWVEVPANGGPGVSRVRVASSSRTGRFASPRTLQTTTGTRSFERPAIAVAPVGCAIATWTELGTSGPSFVWAADSSRYGHPFARAVRLSGRNGDDSAVAAVSKEGDGVAVWTQGQLGAPVLASRWATVRW